MSSEDTASPRHPTYRTPEHRVLKVQAVSLVMNGQGAHASRQGTLLVEMPEPCPAHLPSEGVEPMCWEERLLG